MATAVLITGALVILFIEFAALAWATTKGQAMADNTRWQWPPWSSDTSNKINRAYVKEAGGWVYSYRNLDGLFSVVFVPEVEAWALAIAKAINAPPNAAVSVFSNIAAATTTKQSIPNAN